MDTNRLPPHSLEAEQAVNGSLLLNGSILGRISSMLRPEDFLSERDRLIYSACLSLDDRNESIDITTVADELAREGVLEKAGGNAYLNQILASVPSSFNAEDYARDVFRNSISRQLIEAAQQISEIGYDNDPDTSNAISRAEDVIYKIRQDRGASDFKPVSRIIKELSEEELARENVDTALERIPSGLNGLDNFIIGGFSRADLVILAGRTSMGKTSLALNIARNAAIESNATVAIFSLEMSGQSLVNRLISSEAEINNNKFITLNFTEDEAARRMNAMGILGEANIYIDDSATLRISEMRSKLRRLHADHKLDLVVLDYLQLLNSDGKTENRVLEIGNFTRALKAMARELDVPIIALSQLSRNVEQRGDKGGRIPQLSDLRESGSIEQDADVVLFVHREAAYFRSQEDWDRAHPGEEWPREMAEIIIAKNRNGATGKVKVHFKPEFTKFGNLAVEGFSMS